MIGTVLVSPGLAAATTTHPASDGAQTCTGTIDSPGTPAGSYSNVITGACVVNAGPVNVSGNLTIAPGGGLTPIFGLNDNSNSGN